MRKGLLYLCGLLLLLDVITTYFVLLNPYGNESNVIAAYFIKTIGYIGLSIIGYSILMVIYAYYPKYMVFCAIINFYGVYRNIDNLIYLMGIT